MIVFAGFTPHSPLLLSSISKDLRVYFEKTRTAMYELSDALYDSKPDIIVLISEHPTIYKNAFSINVDDPYQFDLSAFGDLGFKRTLHPALKIIDRIQRQLRIDDQPISLTTDSALHYAAAIPLGFMTRRLNNMKIIPITYSELDAKAHFDFGRSLKDILHGCRERIAVIAAGDLSHALTDDSPAPFHEDGKIFDERIQDIIASKNVSSLLSMSEDLIEHAQETAYRPLAILMGILDRMSAKPRILSYEAPFGVGLLVADFDL